MLAPSQPGSSPLVNPLTIHLVPHYWAQQGFPKQTYRLLEGPVKTTYGSTRRVKLLILELQIGSSRLGET